MNRLKNFIKNKPVISSLLVAIGLGFGFVMINFILGGTMSIDNIEDIFQVALEFVFVTMLSGAFLVYPIELTIINLLAFFIFPKDNIWRKNFKKFEYITLILGFVYSSLSFQILYNIRFDVQWSEALYSTELHQPIWSEAVPTVVVLCVVGVIGYLILSLIKLEKLPPLVIVLSMSAMYLGVFQCILWCVQTFSFKHWLLCLYPFNCVIIVINTIRREILQWKELERQKDYENGGKTIFRFLNNKLHNACYWPVFAFILMWPLLGVILCILVLFGQQPDAAIKAWTETADWRLSEKIPPQDLQADQHYLCTVAAGGHPGVVKPLRMGQRHGHRVVVNRQLCIANAFEQILEEKTPRFHRIVRNIYDTYGFPIAKLIRTKLAADIVYLVMKPLEWVFLAVIYMCDAKPENRIAVQYLPRRDRM